MFNLEWKKKYKAKKPRYVSSLLTEKSHKEQQVSSWHPSINFSITLSCAQTLERISCMCFLWEGVTSAALAYLQYLMSKHFSSKRPAHKNVNPSFSNAHKGAATLFTVSSPHQHPLPPTPNCAKFPWNIQRESSKRSLFRTGKHSGKLSMSPASFDIYNFVQLYLGFPDMPESSKSPLL